MFTLSAPDEVGAPRYLKRGERGDILLFISLEIMITRTPFTRKVWLSVVLLAFSMVVFSPGSLRAHGEIGDDIKDLKSHLGEYEEDLRQVMSNYEGVVSKYEADGADGIDTEELLKFWEDAKMHYAIELNYVLIYAKIWQSIYQIKEGIEGEKPAEEVRAGQTALVENLWQALGAVKMASLVQANAAASAEAEPGAEDTKEDMGLVATIDEIQEKLHRIMAKCAERDFEAATEMVHDTYLNLFEGVEGALIEHDADLVVDLEKDFNVTLPKQIESEASLEEIKKTTAAMSEKLDRASSLLAKSEKDKKDVF